MNSIDSTSNGLYYNATQAAANQAAAQAAAQAARKNEKEKAVKKPAFSSMVDRRAAENLLASQGLPPEIAGLSQEDALVWLKDQLDMAGDALSQNSTVQEFDNYKKAVRQFISFMQKNNFVLEEHKRFGRSRTGKKKDPAVLIQTIDKRLERLNYDIWYNHLDKLKLLEKIHEINGLVVDLTAV
ncbi:MAG: DUF327 family protein [Treponema sp.]|nr:DUF327 family protein [Treponema sp.]